MFDKATEAIAKGIEERIRGKITNPNIINIRDISPEAIARIRRAASMRQMTYGQYFERLNQLHDIVRARADAGDDALQTVLTALGLETQTG
jgi:hypothetical protein